MDYFICQGTMRKLISVLTLIDEMGIRAQGVSIERILDTYKLYVLMTKSDLLKIRDATSIMEGF